LPPRRVPIPCFAVAYDLRSNTERTHYPNKLRGIAEIQYQFFDHDQMPGDIDKMRRLPHMRPEQTRQIMMSLYRTLPYDFRLAYRTLFLHLANGDVPIVFNCTGGKDRTGVAAALVLTTLGVPRDTVLDDYLLTEFFFDRSCEIVLQGKQAELFAGVEREVWEPFMRTDRAYLDAMFDQLREAHGSVDAYLEAELDISHATVEQIRARLLD
jgi:protein-tyrosine phosphatase